MPNTHQIPLGKGGYTLIESRDMGKATRYKWYLATNGYAVAGQPGGRQGMLSLHRLILDLRANDGNVVDHINGDKLDNRRCNLRIVSRSQNIQNARKRKRHGGKKTTSKYKGVCFDKKAGKWMVYLGNKFLGYEDHEHKGALLYNLFAGDKYGKHACLNEVTE